MYMARNFRNGIYEFINLSKEWAIKDLVYYKKINN